MSDAAAVAGLFPGMKLTDALAVAPRLATAPAEPETEVEALQALADWCVRYSPAVAMDAPDGLFLEVSGSEALWIPQPRHSRAEWSEAERRPGNDETDYNLDASSTAEAALLADLLERLAAQGIPAFGAVAATPGAAWALARFSAPFQPAAGERSRPAASSPASRPSGKGLDPSARPRSEARQDRGHDLLPQKATDEEVGPEGKLAPASPSELGFASRSGDLARDLAKTRAGPDGRVKPLARRAAKPGLEATGRPRSLDGSSAGAIFSPRLRGDEAGASPPTTGRDRGADRPPYPPHGAGQDLAPLPVAALRLDPETEAGLTRLGLKTIGQVTALPRAQLAKRLGQTLLLRLDQATGAVRETPPWRRAPAPWFERLALVEPISTPDDLARAAGDILEKLCARLEREGQGARRFHLTFHRLDGKMATLTVGTALAGREAARLARLFAPKLETVDPGFGVEVTTLEADRIEPLAPRQVRLAETGEAALDPDLARAAVAELVDKLQARLGEDCVWRPTVRETWVPERAVAHSDPFATPKVERGWDPARPRPIRLFKRPEPIDAIAPVPDDPPVQFRWRGRLHRVRAAEGPERIAEEWWRKPIGEVGPDKVRDYYRVEDGDGARFWIFRAGLYTAGTPSRWFVHGLFG